MATLALRMQGGVEGIKKDDMETQMERDQSAMVIRSMRRLLEEQGKQEKKEGVLMLVLAVVLLVFLLAATAQAATIPDNRAINAIIGEAEGEPYEGKVALAYALINRGTLKGVYGEKKIIEKEGKKYVVVNKLNKYYKRTGSLLRPLSDIVVQEAKEAWEFAKANPMDDNTNGARGWGSSKDMVAFKKTAWFKNCYLTARIGGHTFYNCPGGI